MAITSGKGVSLLVLFSVVFLVPSITSTLTMKTAPGIDNWPPYQAGEWSTTAKPGHMPGNPSIADLNGDGYLEIILGAYDGRVHAWQHNGTELPGWPQRISPANRVFSSPAVADLDNDNTLEIVVGSDRYVAAWHANGTELQGWPKPVPGWFQSSPSLADLDGDNDLEIVIGGNDSYVYAWHHDGQNVTGWPQKTNDRVTSSPAIGDLVPARPGPEIIVGSEDNFTYAWHSDGSLVEGFPVDVGAPVVISSPALGDLTGDSKLEIVIGTFGSEGSVHVIRSDGSVPEGWPKDTAKDIPYASHIFASPALGDLTGDNTPEIVTMTITGLLSVLKNTGKTVWSKAVLFTAQSSPTIADIDGDKEPEILTVGWTGDRTNWTLFAFESDGSNSTGWPIEAIRFPTQSQPTVADLDRDGDIEIILATGAYTGSIGTYGELLVFDLPSRYYPNSNPWPSFRANNHHSGVLEYNNNGQHSEEPAESDNNGNEDLLIVIVLISGPLIALGIFMTILMIKKRRIQSFEKS
ncbi:MAG: FG-GAP repeat domain-containing protein [Candidatus Hodarchaeota archaeon]